MQHEVRRAAEHADLPGVHRHARHAAGDEPQGVRAVAEDGRGAELRDRRRSPSGTARTTTIPTCPRAIRSASTICRFSHDGWLEISDPKGRFETKRIGIIRAHLEEDAGKSMHDEVAGKADSRIDLNRAGTPLLEIVSQPDLRSPAEAKAICTELKLLLNYLGVSDCNMQEGSLRVDANINLHIDTPRRQSRHADRRSQEHEQLPRRRAGAGLRSRRGSTRCGKRRPASWATCPSRPAAGTTWPASPAASDSKEESSDYRYFPDPDLVPVTFTPEEIEAVRASLGELPAALRRRLEADFGITAYDSDVLVNQGRAAVDLLRRNGRPAGDGKLASNWVNKTCCERSTSVGSDDRIVPDFEQNPRPNARLDPQTGGLAGTGPRSVSRSCLLGEVASKPTMQVAGHRERSTNRNSIALCREAAGRQSQNRCRCQERQAPGGRGH